MRVAGVDGEGYCYLGSLVYSRPLSTDDWRMESTGFGGGRIIASETSGSAGSGGVGGSEGLIYTPYYHLTDHLGSVRTVFTYEMDDDNKPVPSVKSQNDYYPFGLQHSNSLLAAGSDTENSSSTAARRTRPPAFAAYSTTAHVCTTP